MTPQAITLRIAELLLHTRAEFAAAEVLGDGSGWRRTAWIRKENLMLKKRLEGLERSEKNADR